MVKKKVITKKIKKKIGKNKLKSEKKVKVKSPKKKTDNSSSSTVFLSKENESQLISLMKLNHYHQNIFSSLKLYCLFFFDCLVLLRLFF